MSRYRKRALEVEAVQWTGENREEVEALTGFRMSNLTAAVDRGNWIVRDEDGVVESLAPKTFEATYEPADQPAQGVEGLSKDGWSAPDVAIDAAWRAIETLDDHPPVHRNVVALAVSAAFCAQPEVEETYTREQLLGDEALEAAYLALDGEQLKWLAASPPDRKALARVALEAVIDAIDKGKGGDDV